MLWTKLVDFYTVTTVTVSISVEKCIKADTTDLWMGITDIFDNILFSILACLAYFFDT